MDSKPYHHGDLKKAMITAGLDIIRENGVEKLSLRKTAERCGVSSAAPYAHFKSKDDLINAVGQYVMELFVSALKNAVAECADKKRVLIELGVSYVMFFYNDPLYFDLLFSHRGMQIRSDVADESGHSEPVFEFFRQTAEPFLSEMSAEDKKNKLLAMWAMVHGLAAIATTSVISTDIDWTKQTEDIICSMYF